MTDEIIDTCPECKNESFVVEAEGIGCMDEEGNEQHYPIGYCKICEAVDEDEFVRNHLQREISRWTAIKEDAEDKVYKFEVELNDLYKEE